MAILTTFLASLALAAIRPGFPWVSAALGVVVLDFLFGGFGSLAFTAVAAVAFGLGFLLSHRRQSAADAAVAHSNVKPGTSP